MAGYDFIELASKEHVAILTLKRPPVNVLHAPMMQEIVHALGAAAQSEDRALLITASGQRMFSAGVGIAEHKPGAADETGPAVNAMVRAVMDFPRPTVAAIHGAALGGGCELALACDMMIATAQAKIGQPEIKVGSLPGWAILLLRGRLPENKAMELMFSGEPWDGETAHALGMVNRLVSADRFDEECMDFMRQFTRLSRPILEKLKQLVQETRGLARDSGLARMEGVMETLFQYHDASEGLNAFLEKRPANWTHS